MIGGWKVSANGGFTRRLNSATANGAADTSFATRDEISQWLADRGAPLTVRVTPLIDGDTIDRCEATWGIASCDETVVMTATIGPEIAAPEIELIDPADAEFVKDFLALNGRTDDVRPQWESVVERIMPNAAGLWIREEAVGFVAVSDRVASVFSVAVRPDLRRQGLATRIMAATDFWASSQRAEIVFLQVLGTNLPARELYEKLGYSEAYRYSYLQAPTSDA